MLLHHQSSVHGSIWVLHCTIQALKTTPPRFLHICLLNYTCIQSAYRAINAYQNVQQFKLLINLRRLTHFYANLYLDHFFSRQNIGTWLVG